MVQFINSFPPSTCCVYFAVTFSESHTSLAVISLESLHCCLDSEHRDHFWIGCRQTWHQEVPELGSLKGNFMPHASSVITVATLQMTWIDLKDVKI